MAVTTSSIAIRDGSGNSASGACIADPAGLLRSVVTQDDAGSAVYRAAIQFTLGVATPTAVIVIQGSATKTVRIRRIFLAGWSTTSGVMKFKASRRTTAGTLGSAVLTAIPTQGKNDSGTVASATAVLSTVGTANYGTLGTLSAILDVGVVGFNKAAEVGTNTGVSWPHGYSGNGGQAFVLRGTSDWITIDGGADAGGDAVPAGGILCASIEFTEDGS